MSWNYRVISRTVDGETFYTIHEVYYDDNNDIEVYSTEPMYPCGNDIEELMGDIDYFGEALSEPVLKWEELPSNKGEEDE